MSVAAYAHIARLGRVVRTGEVAAALRISLSQATHTLRRLEEQGMAAKVRRGLWVIGPEPVEPLTLVGELTWPYPAYVSFLSALNLHGLIDQLPREISIASLDAAKRIRTAFGTFVIRHVPARLFGGWAERDGVRLATAEKALFDLAYVAAAHRGRPRHVPELDRPDGFDQSALEYWIGRITSARLRTLTGRGVERMLARSTVTTERQRRPSATARRGAPATRPPSATGSARSGSARRR